MSQRVVCPHCSEKTTVDIEMKVLKTSEYVGSLTKGYSRSATCAKCKEDFSCKTEW